MQGTTLSEAIKIAEDEFPGSTRERLVRKINEAREMLWKTQATRELYFQADGCECIVCMPDNCVQGGCYSKSYSAIILPVGITGLRRLEINGEEIDIQSERLANQGCCGGCSTCYQAEVLPTKTLLKHPIPKGYQGKLLFRASHAEDKGKRVGVKYQRHNGAIIREDVELSLEGALTSHSPAMVLELTLPSRCGVVDVLTEEFFSLGSYPSWVTRPQHTVIRLNGVPAGALVRWEALKEPFPVFFDSDPVEISGTLDWKNMFQMIELHFKAEKSSSEIQTYRDSVALNAALTESELRASQTTPVANLRPKVTRRYQRMIGFLQNKRIPR